MKSLKWSQTQIEADLISGIDQTVQIYLPIEIGKWELKGEKGVSENFGVIKLKSGYNKSFVIKRVK